MRLIMIALLMIFSGSCQTVNQKVVCSQIRKHEIPVVKMCDISFKFNRCRCRNFDLNSWNAVGEAENLPLEQCEGVAGFFVEDIAVKIRPNIKAMYRLKENLCQ
jgi:predicted alpha/beta superfamily hydrolase